MRRLLGLLGVVDTIPGVVNDPVVPRPRYGLFAVSEVTEVVCVALCEAKVPDLGGDVVLT